jgi:hypothetical protein
MIYSCTEEAAAAELLNKSGKFIICMSMTPNYTLFGPQSHVIATAATLVIPEYPALAT